MAALVQIVSDVHLDVRGYALQMSASAPTLVIAGDVCPMVHPKYRDFLLALTKNHPTVAYVAGNHEYYGSSLGIRQSQEYIENVCRSLPSRVVFLRASSGYGGSGFDTLDIPDTDVRIVGATMWTNATDGSGKNAEYILNDFTNIMYTAHRVLSIADMAEMHRTDRRWIAESIEDAHRQRKKVLVVTHHSPDRRLSVFNGNKATQGYGPLYYASDMVPLFSLRGICGWVFGHTHESHVMRLPGVKFPFVTNAVGYPDENTGFAMGAGLDLSSPSDTK